MRLGLPLRQSYLNIEGLAFYQGDDQDPLDDRLYGIDDAGHMLITINPNSDPTKWQTDRVRSAGTLGFSSPLSLTFRE